MQRWNLIVLGIKEKIRISDKESVGYFESKKHKTWFDEEYSKLLDQSITRSFVIYILCQV
jgi:hypothetical protein